jgi:transcriptional regulator with XRE-family HTH domain
VASMTDFGSRIDAAQKERHISNTELAKKMKVAAPQISTLKYKTKKPREETLQKIAKALNKPLNFFLEAAPTKTKYIIRRGKSNATTADRAEQQVDFDELRQTHPDEDTFDLPHETTEKRDELLEKYAEQESTEATGARGSAQRVSDEVLQAAEPLSSEDLSEEVQELKAYVVFEYGGKVISKKQIRKLPTDFEF